MDKIRIGVLGTADIARRRFLPALAGCGQFEYAGTASRSPEKAARFSGDFGGAAYDGYDALIRDPDVRAVYIPLPPALHFEWARRALEMGKHVLLEKPFTTGRRETTALLDLAARKGLAVHENYMFLYHSQMRWVRDQLDSGVLGETRLIQAAFGFPMRDAGDFRYDARMGGGALLDCGGYTVRMGSLLLGGTARVVCARLHRPAGFSVDVFGSATLENEEGVTAQISFGMDNAYRCELTVWGSRGSLTADRIFTAPAGFEPSVRIQAGNERRTETLPADDAFEGSLRCFARLIENPPLREASRQDILNQSRLCEALSAQAGQEPPC